MAVTRSGQATSTTRKTLSPINQQARRESQRDSGGRFKRRKCNSPPVRPPPPALPASSVESNTESSSLSPTSTRDKSPSPFQMEETVTNDKISLDLDGDTATQSNSRHDQHQPVSVLETMNYRRSEPANISVYAFVRDLMGAASSCIRTVTATMIHRLGGNRPILSNYDLASRLSTMLPLPKIYEEDFRLRILAQPLAVMQAAVAASTVEHAVQISLMDPGAVVTPRIGSLLPLDEILELDKCELELMDPSRCTPLPSAGGCLLIEFSSIETSSSSLIPNNFDNNSLLSLPVPPLPTSDHHRRLPSLPPPIQPIHSLQPTSTIDATEPSRIPVVDFDFYRPNGTWDKAIGRPSNCDEPIWALLNSGGGRKRTKKLPGDGRKVQTSSRRCAGVLRCTSSSCRSIARPIITAMEKELGCRSCRALMELEKCEARWNVVTLDEELKKEFGAEKLCYHEGEHHHAEPPVRTLPHHVKNKVIEMVQSNPNVTPAEFQTGYYSNDPSHPQHRQAAGDLHPKLTTSTSCAGVLKEARQVLGVPNPLATTPRDSLTVSLGEIAAIAKATPLTFLPINVEGGIVSFTLSSVSMKARLNISEDKLGVNETLGRSGLVTDAHNTFFGGGWTLIQTVVFVDVVSRWLPVHYTVVKGESTEAYERHFTLLLASFDRCQFSLDEVADRFLHVVDFSAAQNKGFTQAWARYYADRESIQSGGGGTIAEDPTSNRLYLEGKRDAETLVRGCERHLEANIYRARLSLGISDEDTDDFYNLTRNLFRSTDAEMLHRRRTRLLQRYPATERWLNWWTAPRIARLILTNEMRMSSKNLETVPSTTNPVESAHMVLLKGSGGEKFTVEIGLARLADALAAFDRKEDAARLGYNLKPLQPRAVDDSERSPAKRNLVPSTYTNTGKPPPTVYRSPKKSKKSPQHPSAPSTHHPSIFPPPQSSSNAEEKKLGVTLKLGKEVWSNSATLESSVPSVASTTSNIVGPAWIKATCWLDAGLVIFHRWFNLFPVRESFVESQKSQSPDVLAVWKYLAEYIEAADLIRSQSTSPTFSRKTAISRLSALRTQLRTALARGGYLSSPIEGGKGYTTLGKNKSLAERMKPENVEGFQNLTEWWKELLQDYFKADGSIDPMMPSLWTSREFEMRVCTDGHVQLTHSPPFEWVINVSPAFQFSNPQSLQEILQHQLFEKGFDRDRITLCHEKSSTNRNCHAPAAVIRKLSALPLFAAFSISSNDAISLATEFLNEHLTFNIGDTEYHWRLVGWSALRHGHYTSVVSTGESEWTSFDSLQNHGYTTSTTSPPELGSFNEVTAFYVFGGLHAEFDAFQQGHDAWTSFEGIEVSEDLLNESQLANLRARRPLFDYLPHRVIQPNPTLFPGVDGEYRFKDGKFWGKANAPEFYSILAGTELGRRLCSSDFLPERKNKCPICHKLPKVGPNFTNTRKCVGCGSLAHGKCLKLNFSPFWFCKGCGGPVASVEAQGNAFNVETKEVSVSDEE